MMHPTPPDDARWFSIQFQPHEAAMRAGLRTKFPAIGDIKAVLQETYARVLPLRARDPLRALVLTRRAPRRFPKQFKIPTQPFRPLP